MPDRLGTGLRLLGRATQVSRPRPQKRGKAPAGIGIYAGLLRVFGLTEQPAGFASPIADEEGMLLAKGRERQHARSAKALGYDF